MFALNYFGKIKLFDPGKSYYLIHSNWIQCFFLLNVVVFIQNLLYYLILCRVSPRKIILATLENSKM